MIKIKGTTYYTITESCEKDFDEEEFRNCNPSYLGENEQDFYDYLMQIEDFDSFLYDNKNVLSEDNFNAINELFFDKNWEQIDDTRINYQDFDYEICD